MTTRYVLTHHTITRTIVEPSPDGPRTIGVHSVTRLRRDKAPIVRTFNPPRSDLLDSDFDAMTDADMAGLVGDQR